jgi:hypothetical protein
MVSWSSVTKEINELLDFVQPISQGLWSILRVLFAGQI